MKTTALKLLYFLGVLLVLPFACAHVSKTPAPRSENTCQRESTPPSCPH